MNSVIRFCPKDLSNHIKWYWDDETVSFDTVKFVLFKNAEVANWDIDNALQDTINHVDDYELRNFYRRFLISIKCDCAINRLDADYYSPYISKVTDDWVTIVYHSYVSEEVESESIMQEYQTVAKPTTRLLGPDGYELIEDGWVYIDDEMVLEYIATSKDACTNKYGIYNLKTGKSIIPNILDDVLVDKDNLRIHFQYKGFLFTMDIYNATISERPISAHKTDLKDFETFQIEVKQHPSEYIPVCFCNDKDYMDSFGNLDSEEDFVSIVSHINVMKELIRVIERRYKIVWQTTSRKIDSSRFNALYRHEKALC